MYYLTNEGLRVRGLADTSERPNPYGVRAAGGRGEKRTALIKKAKEPPLRGREGHTPETLDDLDQEADLAFDKGSIFDRGPKPTRQGRAVLSPTPPKSKRPVWDRTFPSKGVQAHHNVDKPHWADNPDSLRMKSSAHLRNLYQGLTTSKGRFGGQAATSPDKVDMEGEGWGGTREPSPHAGTKMYKTGAGVRDVIRGMASGKPTRKGMRERPGAEIAGRGVRLGTIGAAKGVAGAAKLGWGATKLTGRGVRGLYKGASWINQKTKTGGAKPITAGTVYARIGTLIGETGRQVPGSPIPPATKEEKAVDAKIRATPGGQANIAAGSARAEKVIQNIRRGV